MQQNEEEIRAELEEITRKLVQIDNKKKHTDIVKYNKEYKELCYNQTVLEQRKAFLLDTIKKNHGWN